ncbi:ATP-dependent protease subunit HslV [bacterium HR07]|uniref:ATP-dependent protease subunit HslV n=1 Tax=Acetithermum autotrophicum TaxID=1446466 RepID=H5SRK6_ACEAU|nr:ATP-dependent HslUV protease peptidase subunit HslV [Candidatus Acetothermum autotrophicum]GBC76138.1 ATP-dependent protease subunit HslV [bacterium HR07]
MRTTRYAVRNTTILAIRSAQERIAVIASDGQATLNNVVIKSTAKKVRKIYNDQVLVGFAGATADAITLFERFEHKLKEFSGNLKRAAVELTKDWRTDRVLRRLEAMMAVANSEALLLISGAGDVIEPDDELVGLGSGGAYALAAAKALRQNTKLPVEEIARKALEIAGSLDIYTNQHISLETLEW